LHQRQQWAVQVLSWNVKKKLVYLCEWKIHLWSTREILWGKVTENECRIFLKLSRNYGIACWDLLIYEKSTHYLIKSGCQPINKVEDQLHKGTPKNCCFRVLNLVPNFDFLHLHLWVSRTLQSLLRILSASRSKTPSNASLKL
jgi:hypothetical protein